MAEHGQVPESAEAFEVEYVTAAGVRRRGTLGELWPVRFEDVPPERRFPAFRGQGNWCGWNWSATCGDHVGFESWLERDRLVLLSQRPLPGNRHNHRSLTLTPLAINRPPGGARVPAVHRRIQRPAPGGAGPQVRRNHVVRHHAERDRRRDREIPLRICRTRSYPEQFETIPALGVSDFSGHQSVRLIKREQCGSPTSPGTVRSTSSIREGRAASRAVRAPDGRTSAATTSVSSSWSTYRRMRSGL